MGRKANGQEKKKIRVSDEEFERIITTYSFGSITPPQQEQIKR